MKRASLLVAAGLAVLSAAAAYAQRVERGDRPIIEVVTALDTGEFVWAPELSPQGPTILVVNLATQRAVLFRNGVPIAASTVSTGREGYETPTGVFTILQKRKEHFSNLYDNAPMPNMQRLTWGGVALHAGNLPGYPASHGCIRLPMEFSALLFGATSLGMTVVITDVPAAPKVSDPPGVAVVGGAAGEQSIETASFKWHPERATDGIVSVIVSVADQRAVVLSSGIEIGSAPVRVDGALAGPIAYVLRASDESGRRWLKLDLAASGEGSEIGAEEGGRFGAPARFRRLVNDILKPGSVVIVTPQSLTAASAGESVTVIEAGGR